MNTEAELIMKMYNKIPKDSKIDFIERAIGKNPGYQEIIDFICKSKNDSMRNGVVFMGYWENEKTFYEQENECISFLYSILPKKYRKFKSLPSSHV